MIGNTLQSIPANRFDVNIVEPGELVTHDSARGIFILHGIGAGGESVTENTEADLLGKFNTNRFGQGIENFTDGTDVGSLLFVSPLLSIGLSENQSILGTLGNDGLDRLGGFGPQRNVTDDLSLSSDGGDAVGFEINVGTFEDGAVDSTEPRIQSKQDHRLHLKIGSFNQLSSIGGGQQSLASNASELGHFRLFESTTDADGVLNPSAVIGMIEHGDDTSTFPVVGMRPQLGNRGEVTTEPREIIGPQITDHAGRSDEFQESLDGVSAIGQVAEPDEAGLGLSFLLIDVPIGEFLDRDSFIIDRRAGFSAGIEVMLHPIIFSESGGAVPIGAEVVKMAVDPLLEATVLSGLGGESLGWGGFVTTAHADTVRNKPCNSRDIHFSIQGGFGKLARMNKTLENKAIGSVAQRLEQETHKLPCDTGGNKNNEDFSENGVAPSAQLPNKIAVSSQLNTADSRKELPPFFPILLRSKYQFTFSLREQIRLLGLFTNGDVDDACSIYNHDLRAIPVGRWVRPFQLWDVVASYATYVFFSPAGEILYIGQSENLRKRFETHQIRFLINGEIWWGLHNVQITIRFRLFWKPIERFALEAKLIRRLKPRFNTQRPTGEVPLQRSNSRRPIGGAA